MSWLIPLPFLVSGWSLSSFESTNIILSVSGWVSDQPKIFFGVGLGFGLASNRIFEFGSGITQPVQGSISALLLKRHESALQAVPFGKSVNYSDYEYKNIYRILEIYINYCNRQHCKNADQKTSLNDTFSDKNYPCRLSRNN